MTGPEIDAGLARRLRAAGSAIVWRAAADLPGGGSAGPAARAARLGDEEARVETLEGASGTTVEVDAGPVGAVVLLLEADRRGLPSSLGSKNARPGSAFPLGSIVASWGGAEVVADARPTLRDLVRLARYALP